ncbi:MAG: succinylglutamate desuccinylase/aspartoacylase family protein [Patescibacteria group bacterium]
MNSTSKQVIFVAGIHGSEKSPVDALIKLHINFVIGNPKALQKNIRYIETDLNRVFGLKGKTYEHRQAAKLLEVVSSRSWVIDLHTASSTTKPFVIITNKRMLKLAEIVGIKDVVLFPINKKFIEGSLIHHRDGVVVECGKHNSQEVYKVVESIVHNVNNPKIHKLNVFKVVKKNESKSKVLDFVKTKQGYYPVLSGAKNHSGGFLATKINYRETKPLHLKI